MTPVIIVTIGVILAVVLGFKSGERFKSSVMRRVYADTLKSLELDFRTKKPDLYDTGFFEGQRVILQAMRDSV